MFNLFFPPGIYKCLLVPISCWLYFIQNIIPKELLTSTFQRLLMKKGRRIELNLVMQSRRYRHVAARAHVLIDWRKLNAV